MYAITATTFEIQPLSLYLLNEIKVIAIINKAIPPNDTHIFIIGFIFCLIPLLIKSTILNNHKYNIW